MPAHGAYLGAWINPAHEQNHSKSPGAVALVELNQLPPVQRALGRPLGILHAYAPWAAVAPVAALARISATGAVPMLDWSCGPDSAITSGSSDAAIRAYAEDLKTYGGPVLLRYGWEMNLGEGTNAHCGGGDPASFVSAWRHVYGLFHQVGAANVAFVWCPGTVRNDNYQAYYPGADYVDWIGIDGYDRTHTGAAAFASVFGGFYREFAGQDKPMVVAETGAQAVDQAAYLQSLATVMPTQFPQFKALVYFDGIGPHGNWDLQGSGLDAFVTLGHDPYFAFTDSTHQKG